MLNTAARLQVCLLSLFMLAHSSQSMAERSSTNMPESVTAIGRDIFGLHMSMLWWCVGIGVVVFGVMLIFVGVRGDGRAREMGQIGLEVFLGGAPGRQRARPCPRIHSSPRQS